MKFNFPFSLLFASLPGGLFTLVFTLFSGFRQENLKTSLSLSSHFWTEYPFKVSWNVGVNSTNCQGLYNSLVKWEGKDMNTTSCVAMGRYMCIRLLYILFLSSTAIIGYGLDTFSDYILNWCTIRCWLPQNIQCEIHDSVLYKWHCLTHWTCTTCL